MKRSSAAAALIVSVVQIWSVLAVGEPMAAGFMPHPSDSIYQALVVDEEGRRTEAEFAKEKNLELGQVQRKFAATGKITCDRPDGKFVGTAQLTGANNVITTAAHLIECSALDKVKCIFETKVGSITRRANVKKIDAMGYRCPETQFLDDWAVMTLDNSFPTIEPYEIPHADFVLKDGQPLYSVVAQSADFARLNGKGETIFPKTIDECIVKRTIVFDIMARFETDCDVSFGSSGGGVFTRDKLILVGIFTHTTIDRALENPDKKNIRPYKPNEWTNLSVPLNDAFLRAVQQAIGERL